MRVSLIMHIIALWRFCSIVYAALSSDWWKLKDNPKQHGNYSLLLRSIRSDVENCYDYLVDGNSSSLPSSNGTFCYPSSKLIILHMIHDILKCMA